jgi:hypothetical protein
MSSAAAQDVSLADVAGMWARVAHHDRDATHVLVRTTVVHDRAGSDTAVR